MSRSPVKRLVVTGATGYIGQYFLRHVRETHLDKFLPLALARPTSDIVFLQRLLDYPSQEPSVLSVDFTNVAAVTKALHDVDIIIHLAGDMDFFPPDEDELIKRNVSLTKVMLSACAEEIKRPERKSRPVRFVYVSSTEAMGPTDGVKPALEDGHLNPTSAYAQGKVECEKLVNEFSHKGMESVIVRPTGVFGPGERFFFFEFMQLVATGLTLIAPSKLSGRVIFTHIDDVIDGLLICSTHAKAEGVYNLCADTSVSYLQMIQCIADGMNYPHPKVHLPLSIGQALITAIAPLMNMGKRRKFIYHAKTVRETLEHREYSNQKLKALGFRPKYSVLSGVEHTLAYELRSGSITTSFVPTAIHRCLQMTAVIVFSVGRIFMARRQQHPRD